MRTDGSGTFTTTALLAMLYLVTPATVSRSTSCATLRLHKQDWGPRITTAVPNTNSGVLRSWERRASVRASHAHPAECSSGRVQASMHKHDELECADTKCSTEYLYAYGGTCV